ncbi:MAG: hypothetical protein IBJ18_09565 [Phycisphaerales bacterium]|nr:hypothetical protein [Phycisphaerales bacterium]
MRANRVNLMMKAGLALGVCGVAASTASAQLRVANWNVTNYASGRVADFQNAIYASGPAGSMSPDIIVAEEISTDTGRTNFLNLLNTYPGGPTDWAATPYVANPSFPSSNPMHVMFYRTSKVTLLSQAGVSSPDTVKRLTTGTGTCDTCPPRDTHRYLVRLAGYPASSASELYIYGGHFKAGTAGTDADRREAESIRLRDDSDVLPTGTNFLLAADLNVQGSGNPAYVRLTENGANAAGRFIDPINSPGTWENNTNFKVIHTQEPSTAMDSRHDQILIAPTLRNGTGIEYIGSTTLAYSTSTWNDPNHTYRVWGNDGTTYNAPIKTTGNTQVGATIAQALINSVQGNGHLPVFLDLRVPAKVWATPTINFGTVNVGAPASSTITVRNGDTLVSGSDPHFARFNRGNSSAFETLTYTLSASSGFTAPAGSFNRTAGASSSFQNSHTITMNTSTPGTKTGTITISSNAAGAPTYVINVTGVVVAPPPACPADIACDDGTPLAQAPGCVNNGVNEGDYNAFFSAGGFFTQASQGNAAIGAFCDIACDDGTPKADAPGCVNNGVNEGDYNAFFNNLFIPCN